MPRILAFHCCSLSSVTEVQFTLISTPRVCVRFRAYFHSQKVWLAAAVITFPAMQALAFSPSLLPGSHDQSFSRSSFFRTGPTMPQLPTPERVRAQAALQKPAHRKPATPVVFSDLNLFVKYGGNTSIIDGQCQWMIWTYLGNKIPVPEVYGWCQDGEEVFIYMELIQGCTLEQRWDRLFERERFNICDQLRNMVAALREIKQGPGESHIGSITSGPLEDIVFEGRRVGPFADTHSFNDFFTQPNWGGPPASQTPEDVHPMRAGLPDVPIRFAHSDLHRSNIMITSEGQHPRVLAIIDWHQSGWYPE